MENATKTAFHTTNPHAEHFTTFENTRLMSRLQKKFTPKPYWKNYALLRGVVLVSSYLFNVLSAATAAVLIFFFLRALVGSDILAGTITAAALVALELVKRETGGRFFHDFFQFRKMSPGLAGVAVLMMGLSTTASYFGAKRAVKEFTPLPVAIRADSLTAPLMAQVAAADEQIKTASQIKKKGVVTASAQRTIERLSRQKETVLAEVARISKRADGQNDAATLEHTTATKINATGFAAITLTSELLLLLCLFYLQYYDYRSFVEVCDAGKEPPDATPQPTDSKAASVGANVAPLVNGHSLQSNGNGVAASNETRRPIGFYSDHERKTLTGNERLCEYCQKTYVYGHARQRYCTEVCRVAAWEGRTGRTLKKQRANN